ncbi:ATP-binding protein [Nitrosopumilus sp.]|uniref:sensor histidine kinase n=1 Tax=Nitrosopumilus sp. TaxID=2024843 RepID=UPI00349FFA8F
MNKEITLTVIVLVLTTASIVGLLYIYTHNEIQRINDEITKTKINEVDALSSRFTLRLQYVTGIMELTSKTFPMTKPPTYSNLISDQLKGIPQDVDHDKRELARNVFDKKLDLDYVFYAMPNGDIYFLEPFSSQVKLSQLNFAFRDWYVGAMNTGSTYVSEVYVSANENHNVIAFAVPIHSNANQTLNGIFVGALDLGAVQRSLSYVNFGQNEYFLIVDHNNNIVVDSRRSAPDVEIKRFTLDLNGQSQENRVNIITKSIDEKDHIIAFKTISVGTHKWSIMSIQPYGDVFASSVALRNETFGMIATIIAITSMSGFFMIRKININIHLSNRLQQSNSELELKTEQIKHVDIQKDEFSAMVTHELKTPIMPILWHCNLLKKGMAGDLNAEQMESIESVEKNTKHLESLISDIMDIRKLEMDKMKFNLESVSLDEFFGNLDHAYKNTLVDKKISFKTRYPSGITICTDKTRLRQVFDNVIGNSIKFVPQNTGIIEIIAETKENELAISIKDNGIGIPPEKQKGLFQKFYQIDTSERRKSGGTGLGLAISKEIIVKLGGSIRLESDGKTGTTIHISLPIEDQKS